MKKLALVLTVAVFALSLAVPTFACDKGSKASASKDCPATCVAKANCDGKMANCASHPGCVCPMGKSTASKADAKAGDKVQVVPAVANSSTKSTVDLTGESGCPYSKGASASATDHSCTAAERAKCGAGQTSAKLPNGHPVVTVANAMESDKDAQVVFLSVNKMECQGCVDHVTKTLGSMDGVCAIDVSLKNASAAVVFHPDKVKTADMISAIDKAGYVAAMKSECTDDMKAVFGADYKTKCAKSCANSSACKGKQDMKDSES